jgi:ATP phosphoribosyltransferase regulatory subunit
VFFLGKFNIYTPDGVQDILFEDCYIKRNIEDSIRKVFRSAGFFEIETPVLEFYDLFLVDEESIPQESMFKFFDQQGKILVLRPDITIPVARVAATKYKNIEIPLKFSYIGDTFRYNESGGGRQKEFTQAGVELMGIKSPKADAEVIITAINALKSCGLENFEIDIGQVDFFKGLMEETRLSKQYVEEIKKLIDRKDFIGIEELIRECDVSKELKELILELPRLFGDTDVIEIAEKRVSGRSALDALNYLRQVIEIMEDSGLKKYVLVDLGMVQSLNYYTGVIFRGFTAGVGYPVLSGGRYDNLMAKLGKDLPATGFSIGINVMMSALKKQNICVSKPAVDVLICYENEVRKTAFGICERLRGLDFVVEMDVMEDCIKKKLDYAKAKEISWVLHLINGEDTIFYDIKSGDIDKLSTKELARSDFDELFKHSFGKRQTF